MSSMNEKTKTDLLQEKLRSAHVVRERKRLRDLYGEKLVGEVNLAMGQSLSLNDFDSSAEEPTKLNWAKNLPDSEGLVVSYVGKADADTILHCIRDKLGWMSGLIGFHDNSFLGLAHLNQVDSSRLLVLAESVEDSVVFYSDLPSGVIMVDCYMSQPGDPFSIIVQGDDLVSRLRGCFPMGPKL